MVPVAPPVFAYWHADATDLEERLGPVRLVLSGSAPLSPELVDAFTDAHRHRRPPGLRPHRGRAGRHQHAVQRGRRGRARSARRCPASRSGWSTTPAARPRARTPARSRSAAPTCSRGYWPDGADGPDAEGWWATGDVGFLDRDGDLFLVDRLKELVIVSGFNVYPIEVEDVIAEVDGVAEAAVIGVDGRARPARRSWPTSSPTATGASDGLADAVRAHCEERLARFKQPTAIEVVDELPHTVTGKVAEGPAARPPSGAARSGCWSDATP